MMDMKKSLVILLLLCVMGMAAHSAPQTLTFTLKNGTIIAGPKYQFEVWIKSNDATARMGSILVYLNYNTSGFGSSVVANGKITVTKNSGTFGATYLQNPNQDNTGSKVAFSWTNVSSAGSGVLVPTTGDGVLAFTVVMDIANISGLSGLSFDAGLMSGEQYLDDESTAWGAIDASSTLNDPLPVQLVSFTANLLQSSNNVLLKWSTASETNCYGFEVQKAADSKSEYVTIAGSFVAGHGTTIDAHSYSYTDANATGSAYYRLKQTDLNGTVHYSDGVSSTLSGVDSRPLPTSFALDQNYPNPFNPSTTIEFQLPKESKVTLEVYNIIGQRVAILVDEVRAAGYYAQKFDGTQLGSGVYFCRFTTPDLSFVRKMLLTK
jgi:hypothetical protein